mgnify:CR=1 FL=1
MRTKEKVKLYGYRDEEKLKVVRILKDNNWNCNKTSVQTGIAYNTLRKWKGEYRDMFEKEDSSVTPLLINTENKFSETKLEMVNSYCNNLYELGTEAVAKISELLKTEVDLHKATETLKVINDFIINIKDTPVSTSMPENTVQNLLIAIQTINSRTD